MDISTGMNQAGAGALLNEAASLLNAATGEAATRTGEAASKSLETKTDAASSRDGAGEPRPVLDGPSLVVTSKETSEAFQAMAQSSYETSMTIINNMVDSPEERREKADREEERAAKEFDQKERLQEQDDARVQNARLLDEIDANRPIGTGV